MKPFVFEQLADLAHARSPDAVALFDGKWVVGGLQFDVWPRTNCPRVNTGLQQYVIRVYLHTRAEPAEVGRFSDSTRIVRKGSLPVENVLSQGNPNSPDNGLALIEGRDFKAVSNAVILVEEDAIVLS
jgi:hypothetical protein